MKHGNCAIILPVLVVRAFFGPQDGSSRDLAPHYPEASGFCDPHDRRAVSFKELVEVVDVDYTLSAYKRLCTVVLFTERLFDFGYQIWKI